MEYNTQRKRLVMPEYGRHVQLLVEKLLSIEDRDERTREAYAVVQIMLGQNPQLRNVEEQERKVWEHLYMISNYELDVDAEAAVERASRELGEWGAELLILDCIGYSESMRRAAGAIAGAPAVSGRGMAARVGPELLG